MTINPAQTTITAETLAQHELNQASQTEQRLLGRGDPEQLRRVADEVVGNTFFATLLKYTQTARSKNKYFYGGPGERVFNSQLNEELARRVSLSDQLQLGQFLIGRLIQDGKGGGQQ